MRYLVTGGAGFIGSHLSAALVRRGDEVVVLDNLSTGDVRNLARVEDSSLEFAQGSVLDPLLVDELVNRVDIVVHLAAAVGVELVMNRPLRSFITNIRGSENVLEAAHRYRRKVLIASTSEIYGKSDQPAFKEDGDRVLGSPKVDRWAYSTSKAVDEILAFGYHRERGLPTLVVRLFNTVGPGQTGAYGMVLPRLVEQALTGKPLTVYGDGRQTRCFCHVDDVVRAILGLLADERAEGDVFNVGSTKEITIAELAQRVVGATQSSSEISLVPYESVFEEGFEDMRRRMPDTTKIHELIGWRPEKSLDDIISDVVSDIRAKRPATTGTTPGRQREPAHRYS
ncbi:MAG: NAD-dependent epimerase/dehydratase family protein [Actinobacteria bacterium]|nr:NAD-dependent epimerase/dehydratase family protein [Actinomycetota bacterium]